MEKNKRILTAILSITLVFLLGVGGISFADDSPNLTDNNYSNNGTDVNGNNGGSGQISPADDTNTTDINLTDGDSSGTNLSGNWTGNWTGGGDEPDPGAAADFDVSGIQDKTYNGKAQTQNLTVTSLSGGTAMAEGADYIVTYSDNINAGTAKVTVTGKGSYNGTVTKTFRIKKAANGLAVTKKTAKLKAKKLKKKSQKLPASKVMTISGANGTLSCRILSVSKKKCKKYFKMDQAGNLTVKKKLKKGTYKIKTRVTAAGDANHDAATREVKFVVKVK